MQTDTRLTYYLNQLSKVLLKKSINSFFYLKNLYFSGNFNSTRKTTPKSRDLKHIIQISLKLDIW